MPRRLSTRKARIGARVRIRDYVHLRQQRRIRRAAKYLSEVFVSDHLSRKELKTDQTAIAVEQTVDYFAHHRQQTIRIALIVVAVVVLAAGIYYYRDSQHSARQLALGVALTAENAPVGAAQPNGGLSFPTDQAKQEAVGKAFGKVIADFSGSDEAYIAEYYLASLDMDNAKLDSAKKRYQDVSDHASKSYASLAKLALAQINIAENRLPDAEKLLRELIDSPTDLVSSDQATIVLAKAIGKTRPADAKKLLDPITLGKTESAKQLAVAALTELPTK